MAKRDFYETLGVGKAATDDEIKKAYRKKAMKYHPDRNPNNPQAEAQFKEAKEAYEMLSDNNKRAAYDRHGHAAFEQQTGGGASYQGSASDIFNEIFGNRRQQQSRGPQMYQGEDMRYRMDITLEEAATGILKSIVIPSWDNCTPCKGTGAKPGTQPQTCTTCRGHGVVRMQQGFFMTEQTCPRCHGSGTIITDPCTSCNGQGKTKRNKTLEVDIPQGIDEGMRIRSTGHGEPGVNGGPSGDLYVEVHIKEHAIFKRDGDNLHCEVPISFVQAALGGDIEIPTLTGKGEVSLVEGTQHGKQVRVRGKGIKGVRSAIPGDLYCHIAVEVPVRLNDDQKELLRKLDVSIKAGGNKHNPQEQGFFDKLKGFFA
jgi:molecular chaperone DnaJ